MGDEGAAGEQERMICTAGAAIGALACVLRLTVTPRRDGADDHHAITPARRATDFRSASFPELVTRPTDPRRTQNGPASVPAGIHYVW